MTLTVIVTRPSINIPNKPAFSRFGRWASLLNKGKGNANTILVSVRVII